MRFAAGPAEVLVGLRQVPGPKLRVIALDVRKRHPFHDAAVDFANCGQHAGIDSPQPSERRRNHSRACQRTRVQRRRRMMAVCPLGQGFDLRAALAAEPNVETAAEMRTGIDVSVTNEEDSRYRHGVSAWSTRHSAAYQIDGRAALPRPW